MFCDMPLYEARGKMTVQNCWGLQVIEDVL